MRALGVSYLRVPDTGHASWGLGTQWVLPRLWRPSSRAPPAASPLRPASAPSSWPSSTTRELQRRDINLKIENTNESPGISQFGNYRWRLLRRDSWRRFSSGTRECPTASPSGAFLRTHKGQYRLVANLLTAPTNPRALTPTRASGNCGSGYCGLRTDRAENLFLICWAMGIRGDRNQCAVSTGCRSAPVDRSGHRTGSERGRLVPNTVAGPCGRACEAISNSWSTPGRTQVPRLGYVAVESTSDQLMRRPRGRHFDLGVWSRCIVRATQGPYRKSARIGRHPAMGHPLMDRLARSPRGTVSMLVLRTSGRPSACPSATDRQLGFVQQGRRVRVTTQTDVVMDRLDPLGSLTRTVARHTAKRSTPPSVKRTPMSSSSKGASCSIRRPCRSRRSAWTPNRSPNNSRSPRHSHQEEIALDDELGHRLQPPGIRHRVRPAARRRPAVPMSDQRG